MGGKATVVLDVGKTLAKASLWDEDGTPIERHSRPNARPTGGDYASLDADGIAGWIETVLAGFARSADVGAIIPVSHGAAAAVIRDGRLAAPPMDYEGLIPADVRADYDRLRDPFAETGSPALPDGLNLGAQLFHLQRLRPDLLSGDAAILPWAQYWSWLLSGVASSEVTSLGCHTDLWRPLTGQPSALAQSQGWAERIAPLAHAAHALGRIAPRWAARTGLSPDTRIHCGLHDSNAALLAARAFPDIADGDATILSTGTWFVAMRSPGADARTEVGALPEERDCLVNVDAFCRPTPSARFMGGREIETLIGLDTRRIDIVPDQPRLVATVPDVVRSGAMVLPSFAPGFGPFPHGRGRWVAAPDDWFARRSVVSLYAALVTDAALDLIGARGRLVVEGRFAEAEVLVRALASLRPDMEVYVSHAHNDVSFGALRLLNPGLAPRSALRRVVPLEVDLIDYRTRWRREADSMAQAA